MSRANEIYYLERQIERELKKVRESTDVNKDTLLRYYSHSVAEGLSLARILRRLVHCRDLSGMLGIRFEDATKEDIVRIVASIERKKFSVWTKLGYKKMLKQFYKWLRGTDEAPPEVRWIRCGKNPPLTLLKKDLLTVDEVNSIVEQADNIQYKALFSVLFDSGRRFGEILGLRVCDVEFDTIGAKLRVDGKIGKDIARIGASAPRLAIWIDNHPDKNKPESPLWIAVKGDRVTQLGYTTVMKKLKKAARKAGIRKRVWPYLFRHSRITSASTKLTYSQMCHVFGWKQGSDMPQFYVHLADDERDEAFLKMNGMNIINNRHSETTVYAPKVCPRCRKNNSPDAKYCNGCGLAFDLKYAVEVDQRKEDIKERIDKLSTELSKSPEVVDKLLNALALLRREEGNDKDN